MEMKARVFDLMRQTEQGKQEIQTLIAQIAQKEQEAKEKAAK